MSQVDQLYRLQQMENELREGKHRLAEIIRLQEESDRLLAARERETETEKELHSWRGRMQDLNLELSGLNVKAKRSEDRLYSGLVKNPKELADLQNEITALDRRREALEDELLEAMIMVEEATETYEEAAEQLDEVETTWLKRQERFAAEKETLVGRMNELIGLRKQQLAIIAPDALRAYESSRRNAGDIAVVALKNSRCQGCQVGVPANLVKAVDEGQLVTCDSCGRILCPV